MCERPQRQRAITIINHQSSIINGHAARRFDTETGLYYYRARYYNPYIGRFLQTDPIGYADGMSLYAYCANNPIGYTDPEGLKKWEPHHGGGLTLVDYDVTAGWLMAWYCLGYGETLKFTGAGVDRLMLNSSRWMSGLRLLQQIFIARPIFYGVMFEGKDAVGSSDTGWLKDWEFDPEDGFVYDLLHSVDVLVKGTYRVNRCAYTVTITATYKIYDWTDLKACSLWDFLPGDFEDGEYFWPDYPAEKLAELWNMWAYLEGFGTPAQPYPLYLETPQQTTTFYFDRKGGLWKIEGWGGLWINEARGYTYAPPDY